VGHVPAGDPRLGHLSDPDAVVGALTDTNPVVEGISLSDLSVKNFLTVLANPNVAEALANTLIACGGGTLIAVVIGLLFSWIVVRTNTPFKGFIAAASILPLFAPPLVAGVAWAILVAKTGLINTMFKWMGSTGASISIRWRG
jgi:iron(III) transport system permease protein